jgi:hypothetical protein
VSARAAELGLWGGALAFAAVAALGARAPRAEAAGATSFMAAAAMPAHVSDADASLASLVATDPFRAARHASPLAYKPELEGAPPPPPRPPRPALAVSGIIGGPPWSAVLEGVPGREQGAVVRGGDTLGGLKVRAVKRDTVVITGMDTTWRLIVRRAW